MCYMLVLINMPQMNEGDREAKLILSFRNIRVFLFTVCLLSSANTYTRSYQALKE